MRVYLTGFMGAGKTTVGELLAARLQLPFVDIDREVETATGFSVGELFARSGEAEFRRLERELLSRTLELPAAVVATGGGTLTFPENRSLVTGAGGIVVWLHVPFAAIVARLGGVSRPDRPLFRDELQAFDLYRERLAAYRLADLRLDVSADERPDEVVSRLLLLLDPRPSCAT